MRTACIIVAVGVVALAACALWGWNSKADAEARHAVELAAKMRTIDSLVDVADRLRLQAEAYVAIATEAARQADSLSAIKPETILHEADLALRDAGVDSLRAVLLTEP